VSENGALILMLSPVCLSGNRHCIIKGDVNVMREEIEDLWLNEI